MVSYYDEIEIEDMVWDDDRRVYHYPCPCGDRFEISKRQLAAAEEVATCPSCSLLIRVIYDYMDYEDYESDDDAGTLVGQEQTASVKAADKHDNLTASLPAIIV
ncbi:uncharacterized protein L969DRAFT_85152 [Mixia osmundae IAM 14324]|uniref:Diphthamide biosynthesis protein 3 n=1 Tax=Mixia osmundae (strain CBS 9802 / IAM 14324 / JCM 22182 / KY 12970) TaxID=764103 RepID=G7DY15_MIXOS|nr:uncharacterized protein L969DRAFT_85152 [Mixia osmundae IAM 14324]KEI41376.1 hypothetical protein L969DRAFT_85152 [Mixia osmundae IAM 14324]GAA95475.1 hypothetical protein E5Q_02129 [Mixia osmundae IAM 14324]